MNIDSYIYEAIFEETPKYKVFYELIWEQFKENGFVITDESGYETAVNETGLEDVIEYLANLGIGEEEISEYCAENTQIERDEEDFELTVKNALDYWTEIVADKMLEEFSANDIFDYLFTATYDFEQDFTFDFEDSDEFQAFVDSNSERLDEYKDEYPSVMRWIESGMVC